MHWLQEARAFSCTMLPTLPPPIQLVGVLVFLHYAGVAVGFDWQIGRALLTLYAMGFYYLTPFLPHLRNVLAQGRARLRRLVALRSYARHTEKGRTMRLVLRSAPVACRRLGESRHLALLTMAWCGGVWWCVAVCGVSPCQLVVTSGRTPRYPDLCPIFMRRKWGQKSAHLRFLCGRSVQKCGGGPIFMHQNGLRPGRCRIFMRTEASWPEVEPEGKW